MRLDPIQFHQVHCANTALSDDSQRASSNTAYGAALAFSSRPIEVGERIVIRHAQQRPNWRGNLRIGVTNVDPATLRFEDLNKEYSSEAICFRKGYWFAYVPQACASEAGIFEFHVSSIGELHLESNRGDVENPFLVGVYSNQPLWVFIVIEKMGKTLKFENLYASNNNVLIPQLDVSSVAKASHGLANIESTWMSAYAQRPSSTPAVVKSYQRISDARKKGATKRGRISTTATGGLLRVIQPAIPHFEAIFNNPPSWYRPTQYSLENIRMAAELNRSDFIELFKLERPVGERLGMLMNATRVDELSASLRLPSNQVPDNRNKAKSAWDEAFGGRAGEVALQVENRRSSTNNASTSASTQLQQLKSSGEFNVLSSRDQLLQHKATLADHSPQSQIVSASQDQALSLQEMKLTLKDDNSRTEVKSSAALSSKNVMTTDSYDSRICIICNVAQRNTALLDCSHFHMCYECATTIKEKTGRCPTCNTPMKCFQKMFL